MVEPRTHSACVSAWLERTAHGAPAERLIEAFEQAFRTIWKRCELTLGEVTLTAIVDRVIATAAESYPILSALEVEKSGLRFEELRERAAGAEEVPVEEAIQFALVELLTVLGNLTAEVMTPALHAELARLSDRDAGTKA